MYFSSLQGKTVYMDLLLCNVTVTFLEDKDSNIQCVRIFDVHLGYAT
jgi:hypothetical protein